MQKEKQGVFWVSCAVAVDESHSMLHTGRMGSLFWQFGAKIAPAGYMKAALTKNPAMNCGVNPLHTIKRC
jgi:hypothetical protein